MYKYNFGFPFYNSSKVACVCFVYKMWNVVHKTQEEAFPFEK